MTHLHGRERAQYIQEMFTRIAGQYDLLNRLMTFGQDRRWRQEVIRRAALPPHKNFLLDLGGGTGDLGFEALQQNPQTISFEADFTLEMLRIGKTKHEALINHQVPQVFIKPQSFTFTVADALNLPFSANSFDAVVSGFLLRNVIDLSRSLREQYRVIKPGGCMICLDTTRPRKNLMTPFVRFYMHVIIPLLGRLISGQKDAYQYLPDSSEGFLSAEELAAQMSAAGFDQVGFRCLNFGTIAIHWGMK